MSKTLVINGHPNEESFNNVITQAYLKGVKDSKVEIKTIIIRELQFNPNLTFGYQKISELEPDLLNTQEKINWFAFGRPSVNQLKKSTLEFCGIKPVKITYVRPIKNSTTDSSKKILQNIESLGRNQQ